MDVVIVDDSDIVRKRIVAMLNSIGGVNIKGEGKNSLEAMRLLNDVSPDAFVLDIRIPGENGIEVLKKIKKQKPGVKVVIFTNYPYDQYKEEAKKSGADYFFSKADEFEELVDRFRSLADAESKLNHS